jgi:hypothetical protein
MIALALLIAAAQTATHLDVEPWTGSDYQVTSTDAAKYRLEVGGKPNSVVRLRAAGVAQGWLAAFCTPRLCSPQRIDLDLPDSGDAVIQFELIRESENAPKESGATITDDAGAAVSVPAAYR